MFRHFKTVLVLLMCFHVVNSFYFPGVAPNEFELNTELTIKAVKMTSVKTQLPYYYYSLKFCKPEGKLEHRPENLGEILRGDRIVNTPYSLTVGKRIECRLLCETELSAKEVADFSEKITDGYVLHMLVDNLPAATVFKNLDTGEYQYEDGFKIGFEMQKDLFLNNHLHFIIEYHPVKTNEQTVFRIVGFQVEPRNIAPESLKIDSYAKKCTLPSVKEANIQKLMKKGMKKVAFTYSVQWAESPLAWASRWDTYLKMSDVEVHWFAICNSVAIVLFLSGILALILVRTLRRDIARYNRDDELDDTLEETGWKLVHGDVFRPPQYPMLLTAMLGSGIQIFCMVVIILVFAMFGMLSPASRDALMTAAIVLFMFMGLVSGYHSARMYRTMRGTHWKRAAVMTSALYPGVVFGTGFFLNLFIWGEHSSGAVPFTTLIALVALWAGIALPLVFCGFYFGFRNQPYDHPVRTNQIPRQIPDQVWYLSPVFISLIAGILLFGAFFVELFFIFSAIWENQFYFSSFTILSNYSFLDFFMFIITISVLAILMIYFQLCKENYHWWWKSFFLSGSCAFYFLGYSFVYYWTKLEIEDFIPTLLYFGYTSMMVFGFWLLTGTIGFHANYFFIRKIYATVKQDELPSV